MGQRDLVVSLGAVQIQVGVHVESAACHVQATTQAVHQMYAKPAAGEHPPQSRCRRQEGCTFLVSTIVCVEFHDSPRSSALLTQCTSSRQHSRRLRTIFLPSFGNAGPNSLPVLGIVFNLGPTTAAVLYLYILSGITGKARAVATEDKNPLPGKLIPDTYLDHVYLVENWEYEILWKSACVGGSMPRGMMVTCFLLGTKCTYVGVGTYIRGFTRLKCHDNGYGTFCMLLALIVALLIRNNGPQEPQKNLKVCSTPYLYPTLSVIIRDSKRIS